MFFTYVFRELRRRHRQALLTALGLAVGVALVVTVSAYAGGVSDAQSEVLHSLYGVGTDITVSQTAQLGEGGPSRFGMTPPGEDQQGKKFSRDAIMSKPGQQSIDSTKVDEIAALDGVAAAVGSLSLTSMHVEGKFAEMGPPQGGTTTQAGGASSGGATPQVSPTMAPIKVSSLSISGVDVSDLGLGPLSSGEISSGRSFTTSESKAKMALVEAAYAKQNELTVGDSVKIDDVKYEVVGIVTLPSGSTTANVYIPLARAQKLAGDGDKVNQIYVRADSAERIASVKTAIKTVLPKATVTTAEDLADQVSGSLASASSLADRLGTWLAVAALIASFLVACLLTVSGVSRRVREFGTLKALGWRSRRIVGQVLGESMVVGVMGAAMGVVLGIGGARLIAHYSPELKATMGATLQLPDGAGQAAAGVPGGPGALQALGGVAQTVTVHLSAPVSLDLALVAAGLAVAGGLLAGAFGGWRAARLRPADALRRVD
jgi:ABC-type antimicrobial peptide transport system permease subunit